MGQLVSQDGACCLCPSFNGPTFFAGGGGGLWSELSVISFQQKGLNSLAGFKVI